MNPFEVSLPGIDTQKGLAAAGDKPEFLERLLIKFYRANRDAAQQLDGFIAQKDQPSALRLVHTIKGVAGTLGADELHGAAKDAEAAMKQDFSAISRGTDRFKAALEQVLTGIEPLALRQGAPSGPGPCLAPGADTDLVRFLQNLLPHVKKRKPKPVKAVLREWHQHAWPAAHKAAVEDILAAIAGFRFKEAQHRIEGLYDKLTE